MTKNTFVYPVAPSQQFLRAVKDGIHFCKACERFMRGALSEDRGVPGYCIDCSGDQWLAPALSDSVTDLEPCLGGASVSCEQPCATCTSITSFVRPGTNTSHCITCAIEEQCKPHLCFSCDRTLGALPESVDTAGLCIDCEDEAANTYSAFFN